MKRLIYVAAIASLLMTSCQKTDVLNVAEDTIDFTTEVGKLTKADYSDPKFSTLKTQGFRVWAFADFTNGNDVDGEIYRNMHRLFIDYLPDNGTFANVDGKKYFWPAEGKHLYFYTLSAKNETWINSINYSEHFIKESGNDEYNKMNLPLYTVNEDADDDIMVADSIHQAKNESKQVSPTFRHTMTKVEFNFMQGIADDPSNNASEASVVILKGIETDQLIKEGSLGVTFSTENDGLSFDWTSETTASEASFKGIPEDFVVIVKKEGTTINVLEVAPDTPSEGALYAKYTVDNNDPTKITTCVVYKYESQDWTSEELTYDESKKRWISEHYEAFYGKVLSTGVYNLVTWYMIPQELADDGVNKNVKISYVADGKHIDQVFALTGNNVTEWLEELCVRYNVTIAPHKIEFAPDVNEWTEKNHNMSN